MSFWDRLKLSFRATFLHDPVANLAMAMGVSEEMVRNEYPDYPPSVGEMAASGVKVITSIGSWIKSIWILTAIILALWLILKIKR